MPAGHFTAYPAALANALVGNEMDTAVTSAPLAAAIETERQIGRSDQALRA